MNEPHLWAPWRIDYILGPKSDSCPFCFPLDHGADQRTLVLAAQSHAFVIMNRYPYTGAHLMVVPRRHVASLLDLEQVEYDALMQLIRDSVERLTQAVNPDGVNLGMNLGEAAGAGVESHLHMHLVPRWRGDTNFMSVTAGTRVISQGLEHAWAHLRPYFSDLDAPEGA